MRGIVVTRNGGPEVLEAQDLPAPEAGPGQRLVAIEAAGVNYRDIYEREGAARYTNAAPFVAGVEGAGTDVATGERVAWVAAPGSYAEQVVVDEDKAVPVPDGIPGEIAAAALLQGMTAHYLACSAYPVREGDQVVVHAAAGGVGLLLTQIVKLRGGRVIATTSTDAKAQLARAAGAGDVIGYDGFAERVQELTGGGAHVVYDGIGKATFDASLDALRPRGHMVLYGAASGGAPPVSTDRLAAGSLFLTRPSLHHYTADREELLKRAGDVFGWIEEGKLDVRIGTRYALDDAAAAQADLASRATTGKLILLP